MLGGSWIDLFVSARGFSSSLGGPTVDIASPVTAEGVVKDEVVVHEALVDVAVALEVGIGQAEVRSIGLVRLDARRNGASGKEPHLDVVASPLHGIHTSTIVVEAGTVRVCRYGVDVASGRARGAVQGTVVQILGVGLTGAVHGALSIGVEHKLVGSVCVDALDDVDLTGHRPRLAAV